MRRPRLKIDANEGPGVYHCMSHTVGEAQLFGDQEKEVMRKQMWLLAEYCGVQVLTYTIMSNHFHVLVGVPMRSEVSDVELLRLYGVLHPKQTKAEARTLEKVKAQMPNNGPMAVDWRNRQKAQMFDLSVFMKLFKMRFSIWYNKAHSRKGTLWADRFKSILVEDGLALTTMATYIELNCVRAGLALDPMHYRFCGYAEAVAGHLNARRGLEIAFRTDWIALSTRYRELIFGVGSKEKANKGCISQEQVREVLKQKGKLSLDEALRCRLRYFNDGVVLGSSEFVAKHLRLDCEKNHRKRGKQPNPLFPIADWQGLNVLTSLRSLLVA